MPERARFDYAVIRVVPRVEREEFINVGVILSCPARRFLAARVEIDEARLSCFVPALDAKEVRPWLDAIVRICEGGADAGPIGALPQRQRFHWLVAPRSTIVQTSPVHSGLCDDAAAQLEHLVERMVRLPVPDEHA